MLPSHMAPQFAGSDFQQPLAPYPGLRPFETREWPIFFGRERVADEVSNELIQRHMVVVHGYSGCGKSSLVRAGVLAQLEQEHARSGVSWRAGAMLPREAPLWGLAEVLAALDDRGDDREVDYDRISEMRRLLNLGLDAPTALAERLCHGEDNHVCILVDQFEELFSLVNRYGADEVQLFIDILVSLQRDPPRGLYAIVTMRSEFLGACAQFRGLAEAVNKTQYLLSSMERTALQRAIREPATLFGGEVSRALAHRLITDAGSGQDQLPLIQHGLRLLWQHKARSSTELAEAAATWRHADVLGDSSRRFHESADAVPPTFRHESGPALRLGLEDFERAGGLAHLLSAHADEVLVWAAPSPERQKIVEHLFRALTDINAEGSAVRRPQTFGELAAVTGSDYQTLKEIIDSFRAEAASFLNPYGNAPIGPDTLIDISHEALIRCWEKIADAKEGWLQREFQDGLIWQSLRVQADKFAQDKEQILSPAATDDRDIWVQKLPSRAWTERYGGGWDHVQALMAASREKAKRQREVETERRREAEAWAQEERERADQLARIARRVRYAWVAAAISTFAALVATGVAIWRW